MTRLALIHDYLVVLRGAERTFAAMTDIWPDAPIYTLLYDEEGTSERFAGRSVTTSALQHLEARQAGFRTLLPLFPFAVRAMSVDDCDCIVTSSSAFVHGVRKPAGAVHVCYCHSPFRYAWHERALARTEVPAPLRPVLDLILRRHRAFDRRAASRVDRFVANSWITRERIKSFWGRDAVVVHPPVDVDRFDIGEPTEDLLFVGELVRHKRAETAIEAARAAGRRIKVVGTGPELERLRDRYSEVEFLGRVDDRELERLYAQAAALVVPSMEEFGIAAVEAQAAGRPVVGVDGGGMRETVVAGRTGVLVPPDDVSALARALRGDFSRFDPEDIRVHAARFSREKFQARMREVVDLACAQGPTRRDPRRSGGPAVARV